MTAPYRDQEPTRGVGPSAAIDSSAALVRAESAHLDATVRALVTRLASVPGLQMTVTYRHGRLRRLIGDLPYLNDLHRPADPVQTVVVIAGGGRYTLSVRDGSLSCLRAPAESPLGEQELGFTTWASELFDVIAHENLINHEAMLALRELVERDRFA